MADRRRTSRYQPDRRALLRPGRARATGTPAALAQGVDARLRDLPRLPHVLQVLRRVSRRCSSSLDERHDGDVRQLTAGRDRRASWTTASSASSARCSARTRRATATRSSSTFPQLVHRYEAQQARARRARGCATRPRRSRRAPGGWRALELRARQRAEPRPRPPRGCWRRRSASTATSCCPTFAAPDLRGAGRERTGRIARRARRRGGALPDLLRRRTTSREIGRDTVEVLEQNGSTSAAPRGSRCCGMPAWEQRRPRRAAPPGARRTSTSSMPFVEAGAKVVAINPTCSMMMRREYPTLVEPRGPASAPRSSPPPSWTRASSSGRSGTSRASTPTSRARPAGRSPTTRPATCGRRRSASAAATCCADPGRRARPRCMECCGHDGTYAMKVEGFEPSRAHRQARPSTACRRPRPRSGPPTARWPRIQFEQHAGRKPLHPMSILARAYRGDGFAVPARPSRRRASMKPVRRDGDRSTYRPTSRRATTSAREVHGGQGAAPRARRRHLTFLFENRRHRPVPDPGDAARRADRDARRDIAHELDDLQRAPGRPRRARRTLLIEIDDPAERAAQAPRVAGPPAPPLRALADGTRVPARFDPRQVGEERLSSVQYLKFDVGGRVPVALGRDLPELTARDGAHRRAAPGAPGRSRRRALTGAGDPRPRAGPAGGPTWTRRSRRTSGA